MHVIWLAHTIHPLPTLLPSPVLCFLNSPECCMRIKKLSALRLVYSRYPFLDMRSLLVSNYCTPSENHLVEGEHSPFWSLYSIRQMIILQQLSQTVESGQVFQFIFRSRMWKKVRLKVLGYGKIWVLTSPKFKTSGSFTQLRMWVILRVNGSFGRGDLSEGPWWNAH